MSALSRILLFRRGASSRRSASDRRSASEEEAPVRPPKGRRRGRNAPKSDPELEVPSPKKEARPSRFAWLRGAAFPKVTGPADAVLYGAVIALIAFGVVMVYSASSVFAVQRYHDGAHFLIRQGIYALIAFPLIVAVARIDYHHYRKITYPVLAVAVALLLYVALGFGHAAGGAARWISVGPIHIQPAEMAKLALILWLAQSLAKKRGKIGTFSIGFLPHVLVAGTLMLLCLRQPDFGSAVMMGALTSILLFTAGAKLGHLLGAAATALPVVYLLVTGSAYRMRRLEAFQDPFGHRQGAGYQVAESLLSFGSGGVSGVGIGDSRQKLFFLPEAHTDFISAIVGEELGFLGVMFLVAAFLLIVYRGMRASFRAADDYGAYLAVGITMFVGLQAFTNLSVAMGLLPTKGLVLPFISYGGSSLLVNSAAIGILLNVSRPREAPSDEGGAQSGEAEQESSGLATEGSAS